MDSLANNCKPSSDLIQQPKATILRILGLLYSPVRHQDSNCLSGLGREQTWTRDGVFDVNKPTESRGDRRRLLQHSIRQACLCTSLAAIDPLRRRATASLTTTPGKRRSVENVVGITIGGGKGRVFFHQLEGQSRLRRSVLRERPATRVRFEFGVEAARCGQHARSSLDPFSCREASGCGSDIASRSGSLREAF